MKAIAQPRIELTYFDVSIQYFNYYATRILTA